MSSVMNVCMILDEWRSTRSTLWGRTTMYAENAGTARRVCGCLSFFVARLTSEDAQYPSQKDTRCMQACRDRVTSDRRGSGSKAVAIQ